MVFGKKFILMLFSAAGTATGWNIISSQIPRNENDISDWEQLWELTKNVKNVEINASIDPNIKSIDHKNKFLYSLFSTNLYTFSTQFQNYFYKWALYQWRDWFLKHTEKESFPSTKISLLKNNKKTEKTTKFSAETWNQKNESITDNYELLNREFLNLTLKNIWKNSDKSEINIEDQDAQTYGDSEYAKAIKNFQKFIFDEWISQENPIIACKKTWNMNSTFKSNLYNESSEKFLLPEQPNFDFPDYSDASQEIIAFQKEKKCEQSIITTSDLPNMDGREIDGLISQYFLENSEASKINEKTIDDVHKFFMEDCKDCKDCNISSPNEQVISSTGTLKDDKSKKFSSIKRIKWNNGANGVYIRTSSGITFLKFDKEKTKITKTLLADDDSSIKDLNLSSRLQNFFSKKPGELLSKYFSKKPEEKKLFPFKENHATLHDLAEKSWMFTEEITRNQNYWKTMTKLSDAVKRYSKVTFSENKKPDFSAGLGNALSIKRKLDSNSSSFKNGKKFLEAISDENNGTFELLDKYYQQQNQQWKITELNSCAAQLKKSLANHINTFLNSMVLHHQINSEQSNSSYFLGDYIMDNVYFQFANKEKGSFIKKATIGLMLVNEMKFNYFQNDIDGLINGWIKEIKTNNEDSIKNIMKNAIGNIYYGTHYLSEPIEIRINYGGFKYEKPNDKCFKYISENNSATEDKSNNCSSYINNQKEWIQKANNYWNMKNYVFNNYGYELSSEETLNYLKFLFSFQYLIKQGCKNLKDFVAEKISPGKHAVLVWMEEAFINESNSEIGAKENEKIKNFEKYFRNTKWNEIFNPFFNKSITVEATSPSNLSSGHIGAYAIVGTNKKQEMFGFQGLYTEDFNSTDLPENIRKSIFYKFSSSNPENNKNYLTQDQGQYGIGFGKIKDNDTKNFLNTVNSFSTESALKDFLEDITPDLVEEVWEKEEQNLDEKKQAIAQKINENDSNYAQKLKKLSSRFAGMLQNPEAADSMWKDNSFYIPKTGDGNEGHLVYIIQVNRRDFEDGFPDFIKTISSDTFIKMIFKLSMEEKVSKGILFKHFLHKGITV